MQPNYLPKIDPKDLCDAIKLCSVRDDHVAVKLLSGRMYEIPAEAVVDADTYDGSPITRTYSSGYVFIDETKTRVYLVTIEKDGKIQHQFTGGSPMEDINKDVIYTVDGKVRFHLDKVEDNAIIRTLNRTGAKVTESYNEIPLVDWALLENMNPEGGRFFRLVCLMHYVVKQYEGILSYCPGIEYVTGGDWYDINRLQETPNIAPNAYLVSMKARELL